MSRGPEDPSLVAAKENIKHSKDALAQAEIAHKAFGEGNITGNAMADAIKQWSRIYRDRADEHLDNYNDKKRSGK